MTGDAENTWFVLLQQQPIGPLTVAELRQLAQQGGLSNGTLVSSNREDWQPASLVSVLAGITFGSLPQIPLKLIGADLSKASKGVTTGCLIAGVATLFFTGVLVCLGLMSSSTPSASVPATDPTIVYWNALYTELATPAPQTTDPQQLISALDQFATRIEVLSVSGVDSDAVAFGVDLARTIRELAQAIQRANDPTNLLTAFLRGASGDVLGPALDELQMSADLHQRWQAVKQRAATVRTSLSHRYGSELPPLPL